MCQKCDDLITKDTVNKAMRMVENPFEWLNCLAFEKQLANALELYQDRGEFDGTFESAVECLERANFEIELN